MFTKLQSKGSRSIATSALCILFSCFYSCAGPSSPFGAIDLKSIIYKSAERMSLSSSGNRQSLVFIPQRQVLHMESPFAFLLSDADGIKASHSYKIFYQGFDVTESFNKQKRDVLSADSKRLKVSFDKIKLTPQITHKIQVQYFNGSKDPAIVEDFLEPECDADRFDRVQNTFPFQVDEDYLESIESASRRVGINANLLAALVAQESGFDSLSLSKSRALGLTQITPLADRALASIHEDWPRSQLITSLPLPELRNMLQEGKLTAKDDWRLDPQMSLEGATSYLRLIENYWNQKQNQKLLRSVFGEKTKENFYQVQLASYAKGPSRIAEALRTRGKNYLNDPELKTALLYVRRITSYCYHFSIQELAYAE